MNSRNDQKTTSLRPNWKLNLFPNPASNQITLTSNHENEELEYSIWDMNGRKFLFGTIKLKNFKAKLDLDLINGAYFIRLKNSKNEELIKKLLIAK